MGLDSDGDDYPSFVILLAVAIAAFASVSNAKYTPVVEDEESAAV